MYPVFVEYCCEAFQGAGRNSINNFEIPKNVNQQIF